MKISLILEKTVEKRKLNLSHSALFHMKTGVSPKNPVNDCSQRKGTLSERLLATMSTAPDLTSLQENSSHIRSIFLSVTVVTP